MLISQPFLDESNELVGIAFPHNFSGDLIELDSAVKSLMTRTDQRDTNAARFLYSCNVCGKEGQSVNMQHHIESNHMEGISLPCNLCEKTYRSRNSLQNHKRDSHRKTPC